MQVHRILLPVKPGAAVATLDTAFATTATLGAEIALIAVVEPADVTLEGRAAMFAFDVLRERRTLAQHTVRDAAARAASHGLHATSVIAAGELAEAVARAVQEQQCDLVLFRVGRHGKLSSRAQHVVDALLRGKTRVLILPADGG